ncbi:hypothetical protein JM81_2553 [Maribacter sp. MAR_2009_72]|nr:hypothetical protein JM81_2553 [Maribacter sp. MAR_2009_72]
MTRCISNSGLHLKIKVKTHNKHHCNSGHHLIEKLLLLTKYIKIAQFVVNTTVWAFFESCQILNLAIFIKKDLFVQGSSGYVIWEKEVRLVKTDQYGFLKSEWVFQ